MIALADGGYLVGWVSTNQDGSYEGLYAQRFDAAGNRLGGEIPITQSTLGSQHLPSFAATQDGWIAIWAGYNPENGTEDIMQRHFTIADITVTVNVPDRVLTAGQPVPVSELFSVSSNAPADMDAVIHSYEITDLNPGAGHFLLNGIVQSPNTPITLAADQLDRLKYVAGPAAGSQDIIRIRAFDGTSWAEDTATLPATAVATGLTAGPESRVNTFTPSVQQVSHLAVLANGNYVIIWQSLDQDSPVKRGYASGIYAQLYSADGTPIGGEVQVNTYTAYAQSAPRVATLNDGGYVITWHSEGQDGNAWGVYAQRFTGSGARAGNEFRINNTTPDNQFQPDVTALANGSFVVTWTHGLVGQSHTDIYMRHFSPSGVPTSGDLLVNSTLAGNQDNSRVVPLIDGGYMVVWQSLGQDGSDYGIYARRYPAAGGAQPEFRINTTTTGDQSQVAAAVLGDGSLAVVWRSYGQDGDSYGIVLQRYDAQGQAIGSEVLVNTTTANAQKMPDVIALADGGYLVGWVSTDQDGSYDGVYAQRFDAAGNRLGGEIPITQSTVGVQHLPSFAATPDGWIAIWAGYNPENGTEDIMQRHFTIADIRADFVTIHGTAEADILSGPALPSHILGYGGNDQLFGSSSNDTLDGGEGADTMRGGAGDDVYIVDDARDAVRELVNEGVDEVRTTLNSYTLGANLERLTFTGTGNALDNLIVGGEGNDTLTGGDGADTLIGGDGNDRFYFDAADAPLQGGTGFDTAVAQGNAGVTLDLAASSIEQAYGSAGNDNLTGIGAPLGLWINGRGGDDLIQGSSFDDTLTGGDGDDTLYIDAADSMVSGGQGFDTVYVQGEGDIVLDLTASSIERVFSSGGNDTLIATGAATLVEINGGSGNDLLIGSSFDDTLRGGDGDDTLYGGDGNDVLVGGNGSNTLFGGNGDDRLYVDTATAILDGGDGNDIVYARYADGVTLDISASIEHFNGSIGDDTVTAINAFSTVTMLGGDGNDRLTGGSHADNLQGGNGDDRLDGGGGNDTLTGGNGNDTLIGGLGDDSLVGGAGADLFIFANGSGNDIVRDFNPAQGDLIGLSDGQSYTVHSNARSDAVISFGLSDSLTLTGIRPVDVSASWFTVV